MQERLRNIADGLRGAITQWRPDQVAIEASFYGKNAQSALKLGQARGVCLLVAADHGLTAAEYSPREVKQSVVGSGAAGKQQVQYMVKALLSLKEKNIPLDTSDAIAVALCHLHRVHTPTRGVKSWKAFVEQHPERVLS
jgi:crossover junction endodeoxyribonuclease RuvC